MGPMITLMGRRQERTIWTDLKHWKHRMVLPLLTEMCASAVVASSATLNEGISVSTSALHVLKSFTGR